MRRILQLNHNASWQLQHWHWPNWIAELRRKEQKPCLGMANARDIKKLQKIKAAPSRQARKRKEEKSTNNGVHGKKCVCLCVCKFKTLVDWTRLDGKSMQKTHKGAGSKIWEAETNETNENHEMQEEQDRKCDLKIEKDLVAQFDVGLQKAHAVSNAL